MKHGIWSRSSLKGDGHVQRIFIEKKISNPFLKHRQRQRWKILPGQTTARVKAEENKVTHAVLNVARHILWTKRRWATECWKDNSGLSYKCHCVGQYSFVPK